MLNKKFLWLLCGLLLFFTVTNPSLAAKYKITELGREAAVDDVGFFDETGGKYFLDQFEGKTLLLVFWATWCQACAKEIPDLDMLQKDFRKLPFEVLAISQDYNGVKTVQEYFKNHEIRYLKIYHDYHNQLFKAFRIIGLPTAVLINPEGKMILSFIGHINWYDNEIRELLLSHIAGNNPEPKNSYKDQHLNQTINSPKSKPSKPPKATTKDLMKNW